MAVHSKNHNQDTLENEELFCGTYVIKYKNLL